ncbi:unnamed protein product, partial [Rotaria sordida]
MVGTCFKKGGRFEESFKPLQESAEIVWNAIPTTSAKQPIDFITSFGSPSKFGMDIW